MLVDPWSGSVVLIGLVGVDELLQADTERVGEREKEAIIDPGTCAKLL